MIGWEMETWKNVRVWKRETMENGHNGHMQNETCWKHGKDG